MRVEFELNGKRVECEVEPNELLIDTLRKKFSLRSVKYGCGIGECGLCTVLLDNDPVPSCLVLTVDVNGRDVKTVEYFDNDELMREVYGALLDSSSVQCGFCTPSFALLMRRMLEESVETLDRAKEYLRGNLCRCTGYVSIVESLRRVLEKRNKFGARPRTP